MYTLKKTKKNPESVPGVVVLGWGAVTRETWPQQPPHRRSWELLVMFLLKQTTQNVLNIADYGAGTNRID